VRGSASDEHVRLRWWASQWSRTQGLVRAMVWAGQGGGAREWGEWVGSGSSGLGCCMLCLAMPTDGTAIVGLSRS
jgi:hypothetical protein